MDEAKHKAALTALSDFIVAEAASDDPRRFKRIGRLCRIAVVLDREAPKKRVGDFDERQHGGGIGMHFPNAFPFDEEDGADMVPMGNAQMPLDQAGLMREMLMTFQNMQASKGRGELAQELDELLRCRKALGGNQDDALREKLGKRINQVAEAIAQEEPRDDIPVVPAQPIRGHLTEGARQAEHGGELQGALAPREDRAASVAEESSGPGSVVSSAVGEP